MIDRVFVVAGRTVFVVVVYFSINSISGLNHYKPYVVNSNNDVATLVVRNDATVPDDSTSDSNIELVDKSSQDLPQEQEQPHFRSIDVKSGDSLISILRAGGVSGSSITSLIYQSDIDKESFRIKVGDRIEFSELNSSQLELRIHNHTSGYFNILEVEGGRWVASKELYPSSVKTSKFKFDLSSSLSVDAVKIGVTPNEVAKIQGILSHTIDFSRLRPGSEFSILSSRSYVDGEFNGRSKIDAVSVKSGDTTKSAYLWEAGGEASYYNKDGNSLLPSFRRYPIDNPRITSSYNPNRKHPILNITRPHRGTDFGGAGKPIRAIGDGRIKFAGKRGAFGNAIIIDHGAGVETLSAHQNRFYKGIKTGVKVKRGDVIGYIGSTGLVTGPHLHFEMKVDGHHVNPMKHPLPVSDKVADIKKFKAQVSSYDEDLS